MPRSYFSPYSNPTLKDGPEDEHLTARLTDEALALARRLRGGRGTQALPALPVLLHGPHAAAGAAADLIAKYAAKAGVEVSVSEAPPGRVSAYPARSPPTSATRSRSGRATNPRRVREVQNHAVYAAMVETLDTSVGRILDRLDALDLAENIRSSSSSPTNGGLSTAEGSPTSNLPLRGGKGGWLYEGRYPRADDRPLAGRRAAAGGRDGGAGHQHGFLPDTARGGPASTSRRRSRSTGRAFSACSGEARRVRGRRGRGVRA